MCWSRSRSPTAWPARMRSPSSPRRARRVLQVGHIERFSSAYRTLAKMITDPLYFESYRIAPWKNRGVEVDVILDLMIHDIDMIIGLANSPVGEVDAVGTPVLGRKIDLANARITFESGCIANVTASRVELQDRAAHARVRTQPISQLRSRRGANLRLPPARRSDDRGARGHRHRDATRSRSRTVSPTRSTPSSTASSTAPSRWSMAAPAARRCASRA